LVMRQTYDFSHRAGHGMNPLLGLLFSLGREYIELEYSNIFTGVILVGL
jgi:hypothetical protein